MVRKADIYYMPEEDPKKPTVVKATQADIVRMFYLILRQNEITEKNPMEINTKAFKTIEPGAKICGQIEDGILSVWLSETRQQKRAKERAKKKLMLPVNKKLILPDRKDVYGGKD